MSEPINFDCGRHDCWDAGRCLHREQTSRKYCWERARHAIAGEHRIKVAAIQRLEAKIEQLQVAFEITYGALLCIGGTDSNWSEYARNAADEAAKRVNNE